MRLHPSLIVATLVLATTILASLPALAAGPAPDIGATLEVDAVSELPVVVRNRAVQERLDRSESWRAFLDRNPGWAVRWNETRSVPERVQGPAIPLGEIPRSREDADRLARGFVSREGTAWVESSDLNLVRAVRDGGGWWVQYAQTHRGVRIEDARVTVRISAGGTVPLFGLSVHPRVTGDATPALSEVQALGAALAGFPSETEMEPIATELVILPRAGSGGTHYPLAYRFEFTTVNPIGSWAAWVDAKSGELLRRENRVRTTDVSGQTTGDVELLQAGDVQSRRSFRHIQASIVAPDSTERGSGLSDINGFFSFTADIVDGDSLVVPLAGPYGMVINSDDGNVTPTVTMAAEPGDTFNESVAFTNANTKIQDRDAYYWAMLSHDYIQLIDPGFTGLDYPMPIVTDLRGTPLGDECNAFWNGIGINFLPEGPRCANTARSASVVIHEYGHGVTDFQYRPFRPSGAMHEGFSDYISATVLGDTRIGHGFGGPGTFIRDIDNDLVAPDDLIGEVHADGLIIAAALWEVREALGVTLADSLWHYARYGLSDTYDDYFLDYLVVDDDDGDVYNGTPHFDEIITAFRRHGIGDYSIAVSHAELPDTENLSATFDLTATFLSLFALEDGTASVHLEIERDGSVGEETRALTATGNVREFTTELAAQLEGTTVRYWFTAADTAGTTVTYPAGGADDPFTFHVGADTVPPVVVHEVLRDQPVDLGSLRLLATVTDNLDLPVATPQVVHTQAGGDEVTTPFTSLGGDRYEALLPFSALAVDEAFQYRIDVSDGAAAANVVSLPGTGWTEFTVVEGLGRDFEADDGGLTGETDWAWGEPTFFAEAYSGTKLWGTTLDGPYQDDAVRSLTLGPVDLTSFDTAGLYFRHTYDIEAAWDGGTVFASTDGTDWTLLEPDGEYPFSRLIASGNPGYSGRAGWAPAAFDMDEYAGESQVWVRLEFTADIGVNGGGWFVDDLELVERQVLSRPLDLRSLSGEDGTVPLTWSMPAGIGGFAPDTRLDGFHVYRSEDGVSFARITTDPVAATAYDDDSVVNGTFYTYAVTATYLGDESPQSGSIEAIPYVARYSGPTEGVTATVKEGEQGTETLTFTNTGTGFLRANLWAADPGQTLDDVRIRYTIDPGDPPAASAVLGTAGAAWSLTEGATLDDFRAAAARALGRPAPPAVGKSGVSIPRAAAVPPSGEWELLFTDGADLAVPAVPDISTLEAQVSDGSLYFRVASHVNWGNPATNFNIAISIDTDLNISTNTLGEFILIAGVIPINFFNGAPAMLIDGNLNPVAFPHHIVQGSNTDNAEWGFFLPAIRSPRTVYLSATVLDPQGVVPLDVVPDLTGSSAWLRPEPIFVEALAPASADVTVNLDGRFLPPKTYDGQLLIETNDPDQGEVAISVSMEVEDVTPVRLLSLEASSADLGVRLAWQTASETDHAGFHVYRSLAGGEEIRVNPDLVTGDGSGAYRFEDRDVIDGREYLYRVADVSRTGALTFHGPIPVRFLGATALTAPTLRQNAPNPFRSDTVIRFGLPEAGPVTLRVFSVEGRLVRTLAAGETFGRGFHELPWDGRDGAGRPVSAGMYTYRLEAGRSVDQRKLLVLR